MLGLRRNRAESPRKDDARGHLECHAQSACAYDDWRQDIENGHRTTRQPIVRFCRVFGSENETDGVPGHVVDRATDGIYREHEFLFYHGLAQTRNRTKLKNVVAAYPQEGPRTQARRTTCSHVPKDRAPSRPARFVGRDSRRLRLGNRGVPRSPKGSAGCYPRLIHQSLYARARKINKWTTDRSYDFWSPPMCFAVTRSRTRAGACRRAKGRFCRQRHTANQGRD